MIWETGEENAFHFPAAEGIFRTVMRILKWETMMHEKGVIMTPNPSVMTVIFLTKWEERDNFSTSWGNKKSGQ